MLHHQLSDEEYTNLLIQIAFLPSVDPSTVDYIQKYLDKNSTDELILSFATLGRHNNVADKIIGVLSKELQAKTNDTMDLVHICHALGNTGSKKIIPLLLPFLRDPKLQLHVLDALRTVSSEGSVQEAFAEVVVDAIYPDQVIEVVESLLFPFKHSLYFEDVPEFNFTEEKLIDALFNACTVKFQDTDLHGIIMKYFNSLSVHSTQQNIKEKLQYYLSWPRNKRSFTSNWRNSSDTNYDLVASQSSRANDTITYPYHTGYLWANEYGVSDLGLKVAAGGFGGIGSNGLKLFARGRANIYAWKYTFEAIDIKYMNTKSIDPLSIHISRYAKIAGTAYSGLSKDTNIYIIPYQKSTSKNLRSVRLFKLEYSQFVYVAILKFHVTGSISAKVSFSINIGSSSATAHFSIGPVVTVTGGAQATILVSNTNKKASAQF